MWNYRMNYVAARVFLSIAALLVVPALACAPGAAAQEPSGATGSPRPDADPTSTPWPRFGPPPITAELITPTVQAAPGTPVDDSSPAPDRTPVATPVNPPGSDGPIAAPAPHATPTPYALQVPTPLDHSGTFVPLLKYEYLVPDGWEAVVGSEQITLLHESGLARVTLRERNIDRTQVSSIEQVSEVLQPFEFEDWTERSTWDATSIGPATYRISYSGTRLGVPSVAFVSWHLWGEVLVEVATEVDASRWSADSRVRNTAMLIADSFEPLTGAPGVTVTEIEESLAARFSNRPGNIFLEPEGSQPAVELTCKQVFHDLLSEPAYVDSGMWQVYAVGSQGVQVWAIHEPWMTIIAASHNTSSC